MTAILNQDPPPLTAVNGRVSSALERVVRHCLEKRPEDRFQSARDVAFALQSVAHGGAGGAEAWRWGRRRTRLATVAGGIVLALLAMGGVVRFWPAHGLWSSRRPAPMTVVPLTSLSGWKWDSAFSPDGTRLAFSGDDYSAALGHLADARRCCRATQDQGAWEELLAAVRRDHRRKTGFLATLDEKLARAERPHQSWLERARKRWTSRP